MERRKISSESTSVNRTIKQIKTKGKDSNVLRDSTAVKFLSYPKHMAYISISSHSSSV